MSDQLADHLAQTVGKDGMTLTCTMPNWSTAPKPEGGTDGQFIKLVDGKPTWVDALDKITLERAVEVLSRQQHRGYSWGVFENTAVAEQDISEVLSDFESIAVAEKYLREAK